MVYSSKYVLRSDLSVLLRSFSICDTEIDAKIMTPLAGT